MSWLLIYEIIYVVLLVVVCLRIVYDTDNNNKALAYLLFAIFVPFAGMIFYFAVGINYRKRKMFSKKLIENKDMARRLREEIYRYSKQIFNDNDAAIQNNVGLAYMLLKDSLSPITANNAVKVLINGENKFPEVLQALQHAKHHIHIEYYIYEDDEIGNAIGNLLIQKAKEGVSIRFIYDDFGSHGISRKFLKRLKAGQVKAAPFFKLFLPKFTFRLNYRNHRKIIVIDGHTAFVGGINVSDKYINQKAHNKKRNKKKVYWRDTHLRIEGPGVQYLQYLFFCDWNFCANENLQPDNCFFPREKAKVDGENKIVQIAADGPDSEMPTVLFSILQVINLAKEEILVTTPYFIPGESLLDALTIASLRGVSVKLLIPGTSDSFLVNSAARSYYDDLLRAGVEIYQYTKGFIHAKTMVADARIAMVGTANMDIRSFDLNFEVNALVYDSETANELRTLFYSDIKDAERIDPVKWAKRSRIKQLWQKIARLLSPLL